VEVVGALAEVHEFAQGHAGSRSVVDAGNDVEDVVAVAVAVAVGAAALAIGIVDLDGQVPPNWVVDSEHGSFGRAGSDSLVAAQIPAYRSEEVFVSSPALNSIDYVLVVVAVGTEIGLEHLV
jgi:hypothetical protein